MTGPELGRALYALAFDLLLPRLTPRALLDPSSPLLKRALELADGRARAILGAFVGAWGDLGADGAGPVGYAFVRLAAPAVSLEDDGTAGQQLDLYARHVSILAELMGHKLPPALSESAALAASGELSGDSSANADGATTDPAAAPGGSQGA